MKKSIEFIRRALCFFLIFVSLIFCDFCNLSLAFANSGTIIIDALRQSSPALVDEIIGRSIDGIPKRSLGSMKACRGIISAKTTRKVVALTFDDGPHKKYTDEVLAILRLNNIKGTFFFVGKNVAEYPSIVRAAYADGHIIGNHSYSHYYLTTLTNDEIEMELTKTSRLINRVVGVYPILFRPPYGACSKRTRQVVNELDFRTIMWSADYSMNRITSPEKIANEVVAHVRPGGIILLHDGGGNRENVVEALPIIIRALRNKGYEFLSVPEMLEDNDIEAYASTE